MVTIHENIASEQKVFVDEINNKIIVRTPENVFLGTVDNQWRNASNWSLGFLPTPGHTAIIDANCNIAAGASITVAALVVMPTRTLTNGTNLIMTNRIDNSGVIVNNGNLTFQGLASGSNIGSITHTGVNLIFQFTDTYNFPSSFNLISGNVTIQIGTCVFTQNVTFPSTIGFGNGANIIVNDNITLNILGNLSSSTGGNVTTLTLGTSSKVICHGSNNFSFNSITSTSNSEIENRGDVVIAGSAAPLNYVAGVFRLTTNNKTITLNSFGAAVFIKVISNILIENITVDLLAGNNPLTALSTIDLNGIGSSSIINVKALLYLNSPAIVMNIGVFNTNFDNSIVGYVANGNQDIRVHDDSRYRELRLQSSGIKKLTNNTVCTHLYFAGTATLDLNGFSMTGYTEYTDIRTVSSNIIASPLTVLTLGGSGTKTLINNVVTTDLYLTLSGFTLIKSGFTLTSTNVYNQINATNSLDPSDVVHTNWFYSLSGAQSVIGGTYNNLTLGGSGVKTLRGNVVVIGIYNRTGTATINLNGFTLKDGSGNNITP